MAAQNFKKSFGTEVVELTSSNLVSMCSMWPYVERSKPEVDRTGNGFLANFQMSVGKSRFSKTGGAALGEPEVISTCGFHFWKLERTLGGVTEPDFRFLFPLPVSRVAKSKKSKSHFSKSGHLRSHVARKPEVVFIRSLRSLTEDGQFCTEQQIACRYSVKPIFGEFSNLVNLVITCPTSSTSADLAGHLWHWGSWEMARSTEDGHAHNMSKKQRN